MLCNLVLALVTVGLHVCDVIVRPDISCWAVIDIRQLYPHTSSWIVSVSSVTTLRTRLHLRLAYTTKQCPLVQEGSLSISEVHAVADGQTSRLLSSMTSLPDTRSFLSIYPSYRHLTRLMWALTLPVFEFVLLYFIFIFLANKVLCCGRC